MKRRGGERACTTKDTSKAWKAVYGVDMIEWLSCAGMFSHVQEIVASNLVIRLIIFPFRKVVLPFRIRSDFSRLKSFFIEIILVI